MEQALISALEQGATVVTANRRLARHLAVRYSAVQQSNGAKMWETPDVLPWPAWIARSWDSWFDNPNALAADIPPALLGPEQEQMLWESVIRDCERANALFDARAAASLASEAWKLWYAWRLPLAPDRDVFGSDTRAFLKWAAAFESRCRAARLLDSARVADAIADGFAAERLTIPRRLVLAGFDELTPQQGALLDTLHGCGCDVVITASNAREHGRAVRIGASDAEQEIQFAAWWARARLEQNPKARIGIVVPDLGSLRERITCIVEDVFHPEAAAPGATPGRYGYNISLGLSLGDYPLVHTALSVLSLSQHSIPLAQVGNLLRSPFLGAGETEYARRALLDAKLREIGATELNRRKLAGFARARDDQGSPLRYACPYLGKLLAAFDRIAEGLPTRQPPSAWAQSFTRLLRSLGWPGERALNSDEFQAAQAWGRALKAFAGLECVLPEVNLGEALTRLRQIATGVFQPETVDAPVQVMGMLEASGAAFDHLWLMGLHDEAWPAAARPNPLLPIAVQRAHGVPHASAERELEYARTITRRLLASAPEIVASYPTREDDRDLHPSPLIADLPEARRDPLCGYAGESWQTLIYQSADIEMLLDDSGPPLATPAFAPGGVRLLEDQAACPFRAFAVHRLAARAIEESGLGLDSLARGSLVHAALEKLWSELQTHARLLETEQSELRAIVKSAVAAAIGDLPQRRGVERFLAIEQQRLETLLSGWLELEKRRAPFRVIAREEARTLNVGGLSLRVRIDRIDELVDSGLRVMIDYKTSKPENPAWFDGCPEQPQLPLYSVYDDSDERPAAVLLAHVRQGAMQYRGIAAQDALAPQIRALKNTKEGRAFDGWDTIFELWEQRLSALAEEICAGRATIAPRRYPKTCAYCELPALCRVNETFASSPGDEEGDGDTL